MAFKVHRFLFIRIPFIRLRGSDLMENFIANGKEIAKNSSTEKQNSISRETFLSYYTPFYTKCLDGEELFI